MRRGVRFRNRSFSAFISFTLIPDLLLPPFTPSHLLIAQLRFTYLRLTRLLNLSAFHSLIDVNVIALKSIPSNSHGACVVLAYLSHNVFCTGSA